MYQNHPAELLTVPRSQVRLSSNLGVHGIPSRFSPSLLSVSVFFLEHSYSSSTTHLKCARSLEAFLAALWHRWSSPLLPNQSGHSSFKVLNLVH